MALRSHTHTYAHPLASVAEHGPHAPRPRPSVRVFLRAWAVRSARARLARYALCALALVLLFALVRRGGGLSVSVVGVGVGVAGGGGGGATRATASRRASVHPRPAPRPVPRVPSASPPRAPLPPAAAALPAHAVVDGLLRVDPRSTVHPLYQLIHEARATWDRKVAGQSRSLRDAVGEYRRRYRRAPPRGFDKWWAYVCEHNVPLPDEYDQIHRDLLPFHALSPRDLAARLRAAAALPDTYTLAVLHGAVRTRGTYARTIQGADARLEGQTELIRPIAQWLPDLTVVYSVHDTATAVVGWDHKRELLEHVEDGEWLAEDDEIDTSLRGWPAACPPGSPLRTSPPAPPTSPLPPTALPSKSFIASHAALFDLCTHPDLVPIHGTLAGKHPVMQPLTPIFSLSKTTLHADVLGVPFEQWVNAQRDVPWDDKQERRLLFRGSNTGTHYDARTAWRVSHRARLLALANVHAAPVLDAQRSAELEMLPAPKNMRARSLERSARTVAWADASARYMDMSFTGAPIQCNAQDGTCDDLAHEFPWTKAMSHDEALNYKYVIDVDGNAWSARFKRLLASGSLVFKATIMPEWWTDRIQPWVHYVPIQMDYSDLYDALAFFQGDIAHTGGEPLLARTIADEGKLWSATHWRKEDMTAYVFRLYLEWGRLVAPARRDADFVYDEAMEVVRGGT